MSQPQAKQQDEDERLDDGTAQAAPAEPAPGWLVDFRRSAFRKGFYHALGDHALIFVDRGSEHLVVSFDNLSSAREDGIAREPWGYGFVAKNGWSHLGVMAFTGTWFRDNDLFAALRRLDEGGFFRRYKSVTLIGTSMGAYAACAFSHMAPGCQVIAFSPQSTLRADLVPWEERFASGRRADWSGPCADAPAQIGRAARVWLIYDPYFTPDRLHAERFTGPNVVRLRTRHAGHKTALILRRAEVLSSIVREVVEDRMTESRFYALYRNVRRLPWFLGGVAERAFARQHPALVVRLIHLLRRRGQGFAAHNLRKKYIDLMGSDPLAPPGRIGIPAAPGDQGAEIASGS